MKGHMEGWGEQEPRLYAWELTAWKLSGFSDPPHRKQSVFPRKEQPGTLNTEKQTDKYTLPNIHTLGEKNCFRMRSINLWLDPDYGWWCKWWVRLHVWHTRYLSLNTLSIRLPHNFHLWMLIRGCDNVYTAVTKKTTQSRRGPLWLASKCQWVESQGMTRTSKGQGDPLQVRCCMNKRVSFFSFCTSKSAGVFE